LNWTAERGRREKLREIINGKERSEMENNGVATAGSEEPERRNQHNAEEIPILLKAKEAAALCMMSDSYFYRLNRNGLVPKPVRAGNARRWRRSDLAKWVAAGCPKNWNRGE
jgi:predicted DNA-binding transcriptional regulator AlpA